MRARTKVLLGAVAAVVLPVAALGGLSAMQKRPEGLGERFGRLADCPATPNCVSSQASDPGHAVEPIAFEGPADEAFERLKDVVQALPRTRIISAADGYLYAECTSALFRFVDDVEFLVDAEAQVIHCRSASRVGHSDLGVNRRRIERVRQEFEAAGAGS
jgi:uncharacterized protein (DUF1499 family)